MCKPYSLTSLKEIPAKINGGEGSIHFVLYTIFFFLGNKIWHEIKFFTFFHLNLFRVSCILLSMVTKFWVKNTQINVFLFTKIYIYKCTWFYDFKTTMQWNREYVTTCSIWTAGLQKFIFIWPNMFSVHLFEQKYHIYKIPTDQG
jgi:hypothetical protein